MSLGERELARRAGGAVEIRPEPLRLRFQLEPLSASDGHSVRIIFGCSVEALDKPIERQALAETFLSQRGVATIEDLIAYFRPALHAAADRLAGVSPAAHWLDEANRPALLAALRQAAEPLEFDGGLQLLAPFEVFAESDSLQRERMEQMQRRLTERRATDQLEHVQRATDLLKQFQSLRASAPEISAGGLLNRLSPADQSDTYEALVLAAGTTSQAKLWAVAAEHLVYIDPRANPVRPELIALAAGPARSVQPALIDNLPVLLIGTRSGVIVFDPAHRTQKSYVAPDAPSALGFNRVIVQGQSLWASHSEIGVVAWSLGQMDRPRLTLRPDQLPPPTHRTDRAAVAITLHTAVSSNQSTVAPGARNLTVIDDDRLIVSVANRLAIIDAKSSAVTPLPEDPPADVLAILPEPSRMVIVYDNGLIQARDRQSLGIVAEQHLATRLRAAALLPWLGEQRLLLARQDAPVQCLSLDDALVSEYRAPYRDYRDLAASSDIIAAIAADRQRIVLWQTWNFRKPCAELLIAPLTRHRIADACFL